jgi:hypothetical protein
MDAIRVHAELQRDGELVLKDLPWRRGQRVELIVLPESAGDSERKLMTARDLLESGLVGIWKDRDEIGDSSEFARGLREQVQRRTR